MAADQRAIYPAATGRLILGSVLAFVSAIFILISFSSPYWLESYAETYQSFIRMGLWDFCFLNYRHHRYQLDHVFNGCHYLFSDEYLVIREWLQPGWLMFVQAMMSLALIFSFLSLTALAVILMRFFLKYEWMIIASAAIMQVFIAFPVFLAVSVFGARCQDRSWFLNPLYNHLSWAYAFAVLAFFISSLVAFILGLESKASYDRKRQVHRLVPDPMPYRY